MTAAKTAVFKKMAITQPMAFDEFRTALAKEFKRVRMNMARFSQGTPTRKWANGRPRRGLLHHTKGFAKTERGGYAKRSRRSNTSRT